MFLNNFMRVIFRAQFNYKQMILYFDVVFSISPECKTKTKKEYKY